MINSAIIWHNEMGDVYGVIGFDSEKYDHFSILTMMVENFSREYRVLEAGDSLDFTYIEDEEDEAYEYLMSADENVDLDNLSLVVVTGHHLVCKE